MPLFEHFPYTNFHDLNLDQIAKKIEELESLKEAIEEIKALEVELRAEMAAMTVRMDGIEELYNTFVATITTRFNELAASLRDDIALLEQQLQAEIADFEAVTDQRLDSYEASLFALDARLTRVLNNLPSEIRMISPYTGQMSTLDVIVNELANGGRSDSLTASEYDALAKTATAYDGYQITAYQYDWNGKTILS